MDPIISLVAIFIFILTAGIMKDWRSTAGREYTYSIIIACRNEESNLPSLFYALDKINYSERDYEIILVDHNSQDNTSNLLDEFCKNRENRKFLHVSQKNSEFKGKKQALQSAVEIAQKEILLFTDADCLPPSAWLLDMNKYIGDKTGMVVGYSPETTADLFRKFSQIMSAAFYCATIGLGLPFSSNGRNLAVKSSVFTQVEGFNKIKDHPCGEDKQLLQLINKTNYKVAYNAKNNVFTKPVKEDFDDQQKRRYGQFGISSPFYKLISVLIFLFYLYLPISIILGLNVVNIFIYFIPLLVFWKVTLQKHNEKFHPAHILYLLTYPYYLIFYSIYGMLAKWKWKN